MTPSRVEATTGVGLSSRTVWAVVAAYSAVTVLAGIWLWQGWGGPLATRVLSDVGWLLAGMWAIGCALRAVRHSHGRTRHGWLWLTAGLLAWFVGEGIWCYYELGLGYQTPIPSLADVGYLLFPLCAGVAIYLLTPDSGGRIGARLVLDGLIVAISLFTISWVTVIDSIFHGGTGNRLAMAVALAYPVVDVVVITIAWSRAAAAYQLSRGLLVAGLILFALSDGGFLALTMRDAYYSGHPVDMGWFAAFGLIGLGALRGVGEPAVQAVHEALPSRGRLWLRYVPLMLAGCAGLIVAMPALNSGLLLALGAAIVLAALARQFLVHMENQRLLSRVARQAFRDPLTGLANRARFFDQLGRSLSRARPAQLALLWLDLDEFKAVNDSLGHPAGDELLIRVAERLSLCLRDTDTVARLGGDEFAVLIEGGADDGVAAAERILQALSAPIVVDAVPLTARLSIGLTVATGHADETVERLVRSADRALYEAKRSGGGCLRSVLPESATPEDEAAVDAEERRSRPAPPRPTATAVVAAATPWPPRGVRWTLGLLFAGVALYALSLLMRDHAGRVPLLDGWYRTALTLTAAGLVAYRAWRAAAERPVWLLFAAGVASVALGNLVYTLWVPEGQSPSPADVLWDLFYPFVLVGMVLLLRQRLRGLPTVVRLDAVGAVLAVTAVAAAVTPALEVGPDRSLVRIVAGLVGPVGDSLLLALVVAALALMDWRSERQWVVLAAGFLLLAANDIAYLVRTTQGVYQQGTLFDVLRPLGLLLIAAAACSRAPTVSRPRHRPRWVALLPPLAYTAVAVAVLVAVRYQSAPVATVLAVAGVAVIVARFALTIRQVGMLAERYQQVMTDDSTALPNRHALANALTATAPGPTGSGMSRCGMLLIEVDHFDTVADSFGGDVGEELSCHIAERLTRSARDKDFLARTRRDQFALMLCGPVDLTTARAQARRLIAAFDEPVALAQVTVQVDVSIGMALYPEHCDQPEQLLPRAEAALSRAKTAVGKVAVYHDAEQDRRTRDSAADALAAAFAAGEVTCHYQPKVCATDGRARGVEALVRWEHPTRGLLLPDAFLRIAEQAGLMRALTARVLETALADVRSWRAEGTVQTVAVNLSTADLLDTDFVGTVESLLREMGLPAHALVFEITERTVAFDSQRSRSTLAALKRLGVGISLDDYGTGWSSLARLQNLSFDELKLDKVFVARLADDPRSMAIVRSTVALAHSLGAELVAEGVEDHATLHALRRYGCDLTQGVVHSPPLPADDLGRWLARHRRSRALAHLPAHR